MGGVRVISLRNLQVLLAAVLPGGYKLLLTLIAAHVLDSPRLAQFSSDISTLQLLMLVSATGVTSILIARTDYRDQEVAGLLLALVLCIVPCSIVLLGLGRAREGSDTLLLLACLLFWTLFSVARAICVARVRSWQAICADIFLITVTSMGLAWSDSKWMLTALALSLFFGASCAVMVCGIRLGGTGPVGQIAKLRNGFLSQSIFASLTTIIGSGLPLALIPMAHVFYSHSETADMNLAVSLASFISLFPRAITYGYAPKISTNVVAANWENYDELFRKYRRLIYSVLGASSLALLLAYPVWRLVWPRLLNSSHSFLIFCLSVLMVMASQMSLPHFTLLQIQGRIIFGVIINGLHLTVTSIMLALLLYKEFPLPALVFACAISYAARHLVMRNFASPNVNALRLREFT